MHIQAGTCARGGCRWLPILPKAPRGTRVPTVPVPVPTRLAQAVPVAQVPGGSQNVVLVLPPLLGTAQPRSHR